MARAKKSAAQQPPRSRPPRKKPGTSKRLPSHLEQKFQELWEEAAAGTPYSPLLKEVMIKPRKYRFDFRIPNTPVLVEVQGGTRVSHYGHSSHEGIKRDAHKSRYAQMKDYQVFAYTGDDITKENILELLTYVYRKFPLVG